MSDYDDDYANDTYISKQNQEITKLKKALEVANKAIEQSLNMLTERRFHSTEIKLIEAQKQIKDIMEGK